MVRTPSTVAVPFLVASLSVIAFAYAADRAGSLMDWSPVPCRSATFPRSILIQGLPPGACPFGIFWYST